MEITKDCVYPRKVWPPGFAEPVDLAPYIPGLERRLKEFEEAGLPIPVVWKHNEEAVPGKEVLARLSQGDGRLALGHVTGGVIDADGILLNKMEIPRKEDQEQLKVSRYCSPWIKWNWRDGNGKVWEGPSILHVAVTSRPVQTPQKSFKFSQDGQPQELQLWLADYERGESMPDMPEEKAEGESKPKKKEKEIKAGDGFDKDIMDCLAGYGIHLPPDTDEKNIWERIRIICHAKSEGDTGGATASVPSPGSGSPKEMTDTSAQLSHPSKAEARLLKREKDNMISEIELAFKEGRCNGDHKTAALAELQSLKLSFEDSGDLTPNTVLTKLAVWKDIPKGTFWSPAVKLAHENESPTEVADPEHAGNGKLNPHIMDRMTRGRYKAPAN